MPVKVEIDPRSGFCGGVIRAVAKAEEILGAGRTLHSLGEIVHNEAELARLRAKGLRTLEVGAFQEYSGQTVLIRAHGEPPKTYSEAEAAGIRLIDCTCPVVLRLQKSIRNADARLRPFDGRIVLFGKIGHPEVLGLMGQVSGNVLVIENERMLSEALASGILRTDRPMELFSQTTKSPDEYASICSLLKQKAGAGLKIHNTICRQVASRHTDLAAFARSHDAVVFVSGASSSNGKVLCDLCRSVNPRTHRVSIPGELSPGWFRDGDFIGICGATSTPRWLLEDVAQALSDDCFFPTSNG